MSEPPDRGGILSVLHGFNPSWTGRACGVPEFRRLAFEAVRTHLGNPALRRAVLLAGPRRVGKTTVLQQLAAAWAKDGNDPRSALYASLDHPMLKMMSLPEILGLYREEVHPEGRPALLLLDEIQYSREWETQVKLLVDQGGDRIVASGSASLVHKAGLAESGTGRWITVPMPTLSFYEFTRIRGEPDPGVPPGLRPSDLFGMKAGERAMLARRLRPLLPLFNRYLLVGGFPETARQDDTALCQRLLREDIVERVLKRDMAALFGVRNLNDLERLFLYLCLHTGGILAHKTVADALGSTPASVANYLTLLEQAYLVYRLPPARLGGKQVLRARNKYYLVDAALRNAILLRGEEVLADPGEMGMIVETAVLRHLFAYHYRDVPEIVYWRDAATGKEVDIIVKSPAYVLPFEVKYRARARVEADGGMALFCRSEGVPRAYLVTRRDEDFGEESMPGTPARLLSVPAHVLCYLLGQSERLLWTPPDGTASKGGQRGQRATGKGRTR
jgi:predicted AAA+ superfamily ATPase